MLFADVKNFSKLTEEQMPIFVSKFLGSIAGLIKESSNAPIMRNTWGDAVYFVFDDVRKTGHFALELRERIKSLKATIEGLPEDIDLRISAHVGPVYSAVEPISERTNYFGTHVTRTARVEPVTPPGEVYTSLEFAAPAAAEGIDEFVCDYVGQLELAKKAGVFPLYHLRPRRSNII